MYAAMQVAQRLKAATNGQLTIAEESPTREIQAADMKLDTAAADAAGPSTSDSLAPSHAPPALQQTPCTNTAQAAMLLVPFCTSTMLLLHQ